MFRKTLMVLFAAAAFCAAPVRGDEVPRASHYAAIAYSKTTKLAGSAFSVTSQEEAETAAKGYCKSEDATVGVWVNNAWCSLALGNNDIYAGAWGLTQEEAQEKALAECSKLTSGSHIVVSLFSGTDTQARARREPPTPAEEKMFHRMYGEAGLDADTLQALQESWAVATRRDRKVQYHDFMAKVKEAVDAATPVNIRIENPAEYQVPWSYLIDGEAQNLPSGYTQDLARRSTIKFDRGGAAGPAEYRLDEGTYKFARDGNGQWDLLRQASNQPVTDEEQKMFQEMYGQADLDAETLQAVNKGWNSLSSADRKAQYDRFIAKVQEAVDAATPLNIRLENPAKNQVAWSFLLDGENQTLAIGAVRDVQKRSTIKFDRGAGKGAAEYALGPGTYTFGPAAEGGWELYHTAADHGYMVPAAARASQDPVTDEEQKMFQEMYGQAGLDAETLKAARDGWNSASGADRKAQHDRFAAKVQEAVDAADHGYMVPAVNIRIENPAKNQVAWTYLLDGKDQTLQAGAVADLQKKSTIQFDRGDGKGAAEYSLTSGTYTFGPAAGGGWELYHTADDHDHGYMVPDLVLAGPRDRPSHDPVTPEEEKMFQDMYGQAGLDAETLKAAKDGWNSASSASRKAQYDLFMAKVREAVAAAEKKARGSKP